MIVNNTWEINFSMQLVELVEPAVRDNRKLLVLDIDSTLVWADYQEVPGADTVLWVRKVPVWVKKRPGLDAFLAYCFANYDVAIWSAASKEYVQKIAEYLISGIAELTGVPRSWVFVMSGERCTQHYSFNQDNDNYRMYVLKKLQKIWTASKYKKYTRYNTLVVDDDSDTYLKNYGNAIPIAAYYGPSCDARDNDVELVRVQKILEAKRDIPNVRLSLK